MLITIGYGEFTVSLQALPSNHDQYWGIRYPGGSVMERVTPCVTPCRCAEPAGISNTSDTGSSGL
jgi:hypothetical protein